MLTWHPAGVADATCMRDGPIFYPGGWSETSGYRDCLWVHCGYLFANSVRYRSKLGRISPTAWKLLKRIHGSGGTVYIYP